MLAVQVIDTVWGLPMTHVPLIVALITRCRTTALHTPAPSILAVQGDEPRIMFVANCASVELTTLSAFRSQAFKAPPEPAALKETELAEYVPDELLHCAV